MAELPGRPRRALLIVNAHARNGSASLDHPRSVLEAAGIAVEERRCAKGENLAETIRRVGPEGFTEIIVGGGDGTLNAAAPGIVESGLPLGILPLGTANDLARSLAIPTDPARAAQVIADGRLRRIDLGRVNDHLYFNVASIGFSAALARHLSEETKRRWGLLGYAIIAFQLLRRLRPFRAVIEHDGGRERTRTVQVSVGNGRHYGGGMTVNAEARPDDGTLDVYSLEIDRWWRLVALVPYLRRGTHGTWRDVRTLQTTACTIRTRRSMYVNADGEIVTRTPARFVVLPGAVQVFTPAADRPRQAPGSGNQPAGDPYGGGSSAA